MVYKPFNSLKLPVMPNPFTQPFAVRSRQLCLAVGMMAAGLLVLAGPASAQTPPAAKTAPAPPAAAAPAQAVPATPPAAAAPTAPAQPPKAAAAAPQAVPGFWDPRRRPERPDLSRLSQIRFMTETDYPPFNYADKDGHPIGFNVDLARLICEELKVTCTIQMRRFDTLVPALNENRGEAVIASIAVNRETRKAMDFTDPYYRVPARFAALKAAATPVLKPEQLEGKKIGVVGGSAHEAYLKTLFTEAQPVAYLTDNGCDPRCAAAR
jgi:polar amino acid transport system substrate-binding protein